MFASIAWKLAARVHQLDFLPFPEPCWWSSQALLSCEMSLLQAYFRDEEVPTGSCGHRGGDVVQVVTFV